jgi:membrane-associated phospholipid phosphatase
VSARLAKRGAFYPHPNHDRAVTASRARSRVGSVGPFPRRDGPGRRPNLYWPPLRKRRGIRALAWGLLLAGVAAPALRRRLSLPPTAVLGAAALSPIAATVLYRRTPLRDVAVCGLNMWAYIAAYEMPHDDPGRLANRVLIDYPIAIDRALGLGVTPTARLQRAFARPGEIRRFERVLVWCHWLWFFVPHGAVAYVLARDRDGHNRFPSAAARMYGVFDVGAFFYWAIPTAPPWWAAARGQLEDGRALNVRRMMIEYGPEAWGRLWAPLFQFLGGNPLAAMPSLHIATSLTAAEILSESGPVAGAIGWGYTGLLGLALVYLGEHYVVDLIGGVALAETVRRAAPRVAPLARRLTGALERLQTQLEVA